MTEVYTVRSDNRVGHLVYPEQGRFDIRGEKLFEILHIAEFYAVFSSFRGVEGYDVYKNTASGMGKRVGDCQARSGNYEALVDFCTEALGKAPKVIYVY